MEGDTMTTTPYSAGLADALRDWPLDATGALRILDRDTGDVFPAVADTRLARAALWSRARAGYGVLLLHADDICMVTGALKVVA